MGQKARPHPAVLEEDTSGSIRPAFAVGEPGRGGRTLRWSPWVRDSLAGAARVAVAVEAEPARPGPVGGCAGPRQTLEEQHSPWQGLACCYLKDPGGQGMWAQEASCPGREADAGVFRPDPGASRDRGSRASWPRACRGLAQAAEELRRGFKGQEGLGRSREGRARGEDLGAGSRVGSGWIFLGALLWGFWSDGTCPGGADQMRETQPRSCV